MIKILHICAALHDGGVERLIYNYLLFMNRDEFTFDFVVHSKYEGILEKPLKEMGSTIYHVVPKSEDLKKYEADMKRIMTEGGYDAVHCHQGYSSFYPLTIAKKCGIPLRTAHAHVNNEGLKGLNVLRQKLFSILTARSANSLAATGTEAGRYMWGRRAFDLLPPVIITKNFVFDAGKRLEMRKKLGLVGKTVIGCACRLNRRKNPLRLLDIYAAAAQRCENTALLLIGGGPLEEEIKQRAEALGLENVVLTGPIEDVSPYYNVMDAFVMPTLFEGMGMVYIEAQLNGLPAFATAGRVPKEAAISDLLQFIGLEESDDLWADRIVSALNAGRLRENADIDVKRAEYFDAEAQAAMLENYYRQGTGKQHGR